MEVLSILCVLGIVVGVVTVLGHGMWMLVASVVRTLTGREAQDRLANSSFDSSLTFTPEADLRRTAEAINRMFQAELIDRDHYRSMRDALVRATRLHPTVLPVDLLPQAGLPNEKEELQEAFETSNSVMEVQLVSAESGSVEPPVMNSETPKPILVETHALDQDYTALDPNLRSVIERSTRKTLGEVLQQFLMEKNIQWGELISGLLIVGSAVGLILSLRAELNRIIPMFPAVLFCVVTVAIHLAGFYTLRKWKLPSTSRGILLIASWMIPITALAACLLADHQGNASYGEWSFLVPMTLGAGLFSYLSYLAGRQLYPSLPMAWPIAIIPSTMMLGLINRAGDWLSEFWAFGGMASAAAASLLAMGAVLQWESLAKANDDHSKEVTEGRLAKSWKLFAVAFFAAMTAMALVLFRIRDRNLANSFFALPVSTWGCTLVLLGSHLNARSKALGRNDWLPAFGVSERKLSEVGGAAVAILGGLGCIAALILAAEFPKLLMVIAGILGLLSAGMNLARRHPMMTLITAANAIVVVWLGVLHGFNRLPVDADGYSWIPTALRSAYSALTFYLLGCTFALVGWKASKRPNQLPEYNQGSADEWSSQNAVESMVKSKGLPALGLHSHSAVFLSLSLIQLVLSLGIAFLLGVDSQLATEVAVGVGLFAITGLGLAVAGLKVEEPAMALIGSGLWLAALGMVSRSDSPLAISGGWASWSLDHRIQLATLAHASLVALTHLSMIRWRWPKPWATASLASDSYYGSALTTALISVPLHLMWRDSSQWEWAAIGMWVVALVWLGGYWGWSKLRWTANLDKRIFLRVAECFAALGAAKGLGWLLSQSTSINAYVDAIFSASLAFCLLLLVIYWKFARSWRAVDETFTVREPAVDLLFLASLFYYVGHLIFAYSGTIPLSLSGYSWDTILLFGSSVMVLAALLGLSLFRSKAYQWLAGIAIMYCMFLGLVFFTPPGGKFVNLVYLVAMSPLLIVLAFEGLAIAWRRPRDGDGMTHAHRVASDAFEIFTCWITVASWLAIAGWSCAAQWDTMLSPFPGLLEMGGVTWWLIGAIVIGWRWIRSPVAHRSVKWFIASLIPFLHLPTALELQVDLVLTGQQWVLLTGIAMLSHSMIWRVALLNGSPFRRIALSVAKLDFHPVDPVGLKICELLSIAIAVAALGTSQFIGLVSNDGATLRLVALTIVLVAVLVGIPRRTTSAWTNDESIRLTVTILAAVLAVVWFAWSGLQWLGEDWNSIAMHRLLRLILVSTGSAFLLCEIYARKIYATLHADEDANRVHSSETHWSQPVRWAWMSVVAIAFIAWIGAIAVRLGIHPTMEQDSMLSAPTLMTLVATSVWLVQWIGKAIWVKWNIAELQLPQKSAYVYSAEALLGLGIWMAYAQFSEWFQLPFREYWPIGLLLVALIAQGVSQLTRRNGAIQLSEPLTNTAMVIPVATGLSGFAFTSAVSMDVTFLLGAIFYFIFGAADGSRRMAMMGALFANLSILFFWDRWPALDFAKHPQLWLIPPAASVLIATHVYKHRWSAEATTWVRYVAVAVIFLSSSSEILLSGFGKQLWPPMVLMVLSVATVFLGIAFRIRAYLFSGILFVFVSVFAMVSHAQQSLQHTWPWWVLGISLGTSILVLYGLFEKKREQFRELSEQLRNWQG